MKKHLSTVLLFLVFFVGLSVLLYPSVSNWWNTKHMSRAIADYDESVQALQPEDYTAYWAAAQDYNTRLAQTPQAFYDPALVDGYEQALNVSGTGIMGTVNIDKIHVTLPIYHGTDEGVLAVGAGHLQGTSLPTGDKGTHCVLSAHRGLPSATLFSNLDQLEAGDTFTVTVLDKMFTYQVDKISIVLPSEVEDLQIDPNQDYCTLMTCTPYGINSHRLLVRGVRVQNAADTRINVEPDARQVDPLVVAPAVALPVLLVLLAVLLLKYRKPPKKRN